MTSDGSLPSRSTLSGPASGPISSRHRTSVPAGLPCQPWRRLPACGRGRRGCAGWRRDIAPTDAYRRSSPRCCATPPRCAPATASIGRLARIRPVLGRRPATGDVARRRRPADGGSRPGGDVLAGVDPRRRPAGDGCAGGTRVSTCSSSIETASTLCSGSSTRLAAHAWDALQELAGEDAWYVDWERGSRRGTVALRRGSLPVPTATVDDAGRSTGRGRPATSSSGPSRRRRLTFWEPGTSGKHEMIGVRGQSRFDVRSTPTVETIDGHQLPRSQRVPGRQRARALQWRHRRRVHLGRRVGRALAGGVRRVVGAGGT